MKMKKIMGICMSVVIAFIMVLSICVNANAATFDWNSTKTPGTTTSSTDKVKIPLYKGTLTFKVNTMNGNCSYLAAKCQSYYENKYYINNTSKSILISLVGGTQSFSMKFVNGGDSEEYMYLACSIQHNAQIADLLTASGIIFY